MVASEEELSGGVEWGHLRPGHFRFIFAPIHELHAAESSSVSDESESEDEESEAALRARREEMAKASMFEATNRTVADKARVLAGKGMAAMGKMVQRGGEALSSLEHHAAASRRKRRERREHDARRESSSSSSDDDDDDQPPTPRWASESGFRVLLTGTVPSEGLAGDPEKALPRDWRAHLRVIEGIVGYLNPRNIGRLVVLGQAWANAGYADPRYYDLVQVGRCSASMVAHARRVDAVRYHSGTILSSGEKRVLAFSHAGDFVCETAIHDTAVVCVVLVAAGSLWTASTNGAIREWSMPHDIERIEFRAQLWEHSKAVNDLCSTEAAISFAGRQAPQKLVSCGDDRTVRVWNIVAKRCEAVLRPFNHYCATMRSVCVSDAHLFVGSSNGMVYAYSADGRTRRLSNKQKTRVGVEALFPLEMELANGDNVISAIRSAPAYRGTKDTTTPSTPTRNDSHAVLYVASYDGSLRIWSIPKKNLDFELTHTITEHTDRITALHVARQHVITAADDHTIRFYGLYHASDFDDHALERVVRTESRIKCLDFSNSPSSSEYAGTLLCGMSNGVVQVYPCGPSI
ncbi:hypothetical protein CTAYLR_000207 [Chrysophaeum taylorii]|uniref:Uncharacterized protein n=1 Tax=Chrysophaeum taylorii TaxID=2483200 RepID=A0AAD7UGL4_9STRA|nr:hypothetical protein CTAYLR_000207 [Chrysophaeum taylorii]